MIPSPTPRTSSVFLRVSMSSVLTLSFLSRPFAAAQSLEPTTVGIAVLTLFHPKTLLLSTPRPTALRLDAITLLLPANQPLTLRPTPTGLAADLPDTSPIFAQTLILSAGTFTLTVPDKLHRTYIGSLTLTTHAAALVPVVAIDTELAVASILAAESPPHASPEALKAQAVVSRSFLLARPSAHSAFDACDTTHCQFLRSPPPPDSIFTAATRATRNLVLTWRASPADAARVIPAMYSRSCGGHTRPHPTGPSAYPFYAVACAYCRRHPETWTRPAPDSPVDTEQQRIAFNRIHGWSAIPSNVHSGTSATMVGTGTGHGVGLCQLGAEDLARQGATYSEILSHFFPNTSLTLLP